MIGKALLIALVAAAVLKSAHPLGGHLRQTFCYAAAAIGRTTVLCIDTDP